MRILKTITIPLVYGRPESTWANTLRSPFIPHSPTVGLSGGRGSKLGAWLTLLGSPPYDTIVVNQRPPVLSHDHVSMTGLPCLQGSASRPPNSPHPPPSDSLNSSADVLAGHACVAGLAQACLEQQEVHLGFGHETT